MGHSHRQYLETTQDRGPFPTPYCHSRLALWRFHRSDGLKQDMFIESDISGLAVETANWVATSYQTPPGFSSWGPYSHSPEQWDKIPELGRIMWSMSPDFYTVGEFYRTDAYLRRRNHDVTAEASYVWDVWGGDLKSPLEGAFRMYNSDRTIEPVYDLDRRPWAKLIEALDAGRKMNALISDVT